MSTFYAIKELTTGLYLQNSFQLDMHPHVYKTLSGAKSRFTWLARFGASRFYRNDIPKRRNLNGRWVEKPKFVVVPVTFEEGEPVELEIPVRGRGTVRAR